MKQMDYMTDEELLALMEQVEQHELVSAPPGLAERVLQKIEQTDTGGKSGEQSGQRKHFRLYCCKVVVAMAASIVLLFALPSLSKQLWVEEVPSKETLLSEIPLKTKQEAMSESGKSLFEKIGESKPWKELSKNVRENIAEVVK